MKRAYLIIFSFLLMSIDVSLSELRSKSAIESSVYIISPSADQEVINPITIKFGIKGMNLSPAGIEKEFSGHHHLLIDLKDLPDLSKPIPSDKNHMHFGKGQTEVTIQLPIGEHTLQLLFADFLHIPHHKPLYSDKIKIYVKE
tara:strand:- start:403 stop:831 length:429 start_codon:yes stop_codon:yes gene_type:complete